MISSVIYITMTTTAKALTRWATDNADELTLTPAGRYLVVVLYRQYLAGLNNLREQARSELTGVEHDLLFGDGTEK